MVDITDYKISKLNESKEFTPSNPFDGGEPFPFKFYIRSIHSPHVQNVVNEHRRDGDYEEWHKLDACIESLEGDLKFNGEQITNSHKSDFIESICKDSEYSWLTNQFYLFAIGGDTLGKLRQNLKSTPDK